MTRPRSMPGYLLLPRPGDTVKLLILPGGFVLGVLTRGAPGLGVWLRALLVWVCLELLARVVVALVAAFEIRWFIIGAGYALRALTGLGLAVHLTRPLGLLPLAISAAWAVGCAWATSRRPAPWSAIGFLAGALAAATGFLLVEPHASVFDLLLVGVVGAAASAVGVAVGDYRPAATAFGFVLVLAAAAMAGTHNPLSAALVWAAFALVQVGSLRQDRASRGHDSPAVGRRRPRHVATEPRESGSEAPAT